MILENEVKLDFSDVLIRPKRSTLESRSQVNLVREFTPKYGKPFSGIPIIAANMATGTFEMLDAFSKEKMFVAIAKHFNDKWSYHLTENMDFEVVKNYLDYGFYTVGMSDEELLKLVQVANGFKSDTGDKANIKICIDIANGYTQKFASFVSKVRKAFPENVIIAGNVATPEMVQELIIAGADYIKIGLGPGCFIPGTRIKTISGLKNIEEVKVGDEVYTHTGNVKKVIDTLCYNENEKIISVNGIKSTSYHEYYVIEKQYKNIVNDDNIHEYAKWISADKLDKNIHLLIRRK